MRVIGDYRRHSGTAGATKGWPGWSVFGFLLLNISKLEFPRVFSFPLCRLALLCWTAFFSDWFWGTWQAAQSID